jgi:site-specific DNA-cytosine methylase
MNVLSLFDGISCGQIALERAGIKVDNYFASEIDDVAMEITQKNYPNTIQLGDVTKWYEWELPKIDLLIGGSPCQGFSVNGKGLNFHDPRSKLFFEFTDVLNTTQPKYFLLENVKMKKRWEEIITNSLYVNPIEINSALVSAQMRKRLYWTNIPNVTQPKDRGVKLKDIIDDGYVEKDKSWCMLESWNRFPKKTESAIGRYKRSMMPIVFSSPDFDFYKGWRSLNLKECCRLQTVPEDYFEGVNEQKAMGLLGNGWTVDVIAHIFKNIQ